MRSETGFSLVEVLIAWVAVSLVSTSLWVMQLDCSKKIHFLMTRSISVALFASVLPVLERLNPRDQQQFSHFVENQFSQMLPDAHADIWCEVKRCCVHAYWGGNNKKQELYLERTRLKSD